MSTHSHISFILSKTLKFFYYLNTNSSVHVKQEIYIRTDRGLLQNLNFFPNHSYHLNNIPSIVCALEHCLAKCIDKQTIHGWVGLFVETKQFKNHWPIKSEFRRPPPLVWSLNIKCYFFTIRLNWLSPFSRLGIQQSLLAMLNNRDKGFVDGDDDNHKRKKSRNLLDTLMRSDEVKLIF